MLSAILWLVLVVILIAWVGGIALGALGPLIHVLLVVALIVLVVNLLLWLGGRGTYPD